MTSEKAAPEDFLVLRTKREALGLTLKDVFALTRISVVNLEAIENGGFNDLPVPIYTKNFIKIYARALDLDSKPILDSYEAYLNSLRIAQTKIPEDVPEKEQEPFIKRFAHYKAYIVTASVIIIAGVATFIISQQHQLVPEVTVPQPAIVATTPQVAVSTPVIPPEQAAPAAQPKTVVRPAPIVASKPVLPQPALPRQQSPAQLTAPSQKNVPVVEKKVPVLIREGNDILVIKATEETWLRMKIDQNIPFQVLLKPGEEIKRKGAGFDLDIGNAGGITMQFKGKTIENMGKSGEVVHLQLP